MFNQQSSQIIQNEFFIFMFNKLMRILSIIITKKILFQNLQNMYTSRPTKQHQKKGMELMKKLISSQRRVKTMIYNQENINFQSQTSLQHVLNQSLNNSMSKPSQQKLYSTSETTIQNTRNSIPQVSKLKKKSQFIASDLVDFQKKNRQRIYSHNLSFQSPQKSFKSSLRKQKKLSDYQRKMNNSLQHLNFTTMKESILMHRVESYTEHFLKVQKQFIDRKQSFQKLKNSSVKKDKFSPKLNKLKTLSQDKKSKQRKFQEDLKLKQAKLYEERQNIKQTRKNFVDLLQEAKAKTKQYDEDLFQMEIKEKQMQDEIERYESQEKDRKQKIMVLKNQFQQLSSTVQKQRQFLQKQKKLLTQNILNTQQKNSSITRKIYHLKQQFIQLQQNDSAIRKKQQSNKELIRQLIRQEDKVNKLRIAKQMKIIEKRQQMRQKLLDQLQAQDKRQIYDRLDKELNFIKEYYKISSNSRQFKKNIKKMTKYQTIIKQIKKFQTSPQYSEDIMNMYKRELWDIGMPRFLAEQVMYIQAPQVRKLKNTLKQIDTKKQSLNQILKEKQRLVNVLSFKSKKLTEQIQQMKEIQERKKEQQDIASQIDWGF